MPLTALRLSTRLEPHPKSERLNNMNWERMQYVVLGLTIAGQVCIGVNYFLGQGLWLVANGITVCRNFKMHRPKADKVQGWFMLALTFGLIATNAIVW